MSPRARRIGLGVVSLAFFAVVAWMLADELRELDPREIAAALRSLYSWRIAAACGLTAVCYAIVASYDRLASRYAGVRLPAAVGFSIPFVSYAFNFNLGAIVGGLGFRYRLYSRENVEARKIAAITAFSIVTNWCGCLTVLGAILIADPFALEIGWNVPAGWGRLLGVLVLAPVLAYAVVAAVRKAPVRIRGQLYRVPDLRWVLVQICLASAYWLLVPAILYLLRPAGVEIAYSQLAAAYGLAAMGGVVIRVPAGLGVIEAVFVEVFRGRIGAEPILGLLIAWRAVFLLLPLAVAAIVLAVLELRGRFTRAAHRAAAAR